MRVWRGGLMLAGTVVPAVVGSWVAGPAAEAASSWNSVSESQSAQLACSESDGVKVGSADYQGTEVGQLWYSSSCRTVWGKWLGDDEASLGSPTGWLVRSDNYNTSHDIGCGFDGWCVTDHINDAGYTTKLQVQLFWHGPIVSTPAY
ncbi:hypothetical protein [Pseudofrankia sp. BMG5.36]|uniref:hypothetical protein n=1 Tax=Pseudofrankia sp. BMG5.36 TaxID=1834512 RepID=UPI0009235C96|nr:hypothetical protein [Pseudofrankia sp. BMG5.36]OHV43667.1 hypothetical protein BCD48_27155 [Pseudofrankia sp. BMG5.36]